MGGQCTAFAKPPAGRGIFRASQPGRRGQDSAPSSSTAALSADAAGASTVLESSAEKPDGIERFGACFGGSRSSTQLLLLVVAAGALLTLGGSVMLYYGPERTVRYIMNNGVPRNPSWAFTVIWMLVVMTSVVCVLPLWVPMAMATPIIFGFYEGWVINFLAMQLAALGSIAIAQAFLRDPIRNFIVDGDYPMVRKAMLLLEDGDASLTLLVLFRFLCIPLFVKNYGLGALQVPLWKLSVSTVPHCMWMGFLFTSLGFPIGSSMQRMRDHQDIPSHEWLLVELLPCALAAVASTAVCFLAHRKYEQILKADERALPTAEGQGEQTCC